MGEAMSTAKTRIRRGACDVVHGWLETGAVEELQDEADRRRMHRDEMVARLLEVIIAHRIYDHLLDRLANLPVGDLRP